MAAHPHGQPASQRAWARARLTRGSSTGEVWEISSDYPEARLSVGADFGAGWSIQALGVHPIHCELFWDGGALWVADTHGVGGVFLDGVRVAEWVQIHGPAELRFAQAALDIETSAPEQVQMASSPALARPITLTDLVAASERPSAPIFGGAASEEQVLDLEAAATRMVAAPSPAAPPGHARASAPSAPAGSDLRPRLGSSGIAPAAEATRMVPMPGPPANAPGAPPSLSSPFGLGPAAVVAPPPAAPGFGQPPPSLGPPAVPLAAPGQQRVDPPTVPVPDAGGFVGPPVDGGSGGKKGGLAQVLVALKPQSSAEVVQAAGGKPGQALPTRTWIMLGVVVVAVVGLLLWEEEEPEVAAPQEPAAVSARPTTVAVGPTPPPTPAPVAPAPVAPAPVVPAPVEPAPVEPAPVVSAPVEPGVDPAVAAVPMPAPQPGSQPADGADQAPVGPTMQRQAVDLYITGRYPEALVLYRQLAAASPDDASYSSLVGILERRVACRDGVGEGGRPCGQP